MPIGRDARSESGVWRSALNAAARVRQRAPIDATVVGIMDRDNWTANTDNIVIVDSRRRSLLWVPRDLWSPVVGDRINAAYSRGGHEAFQSALRELGLPVSASIVFLRSAVERALADLRITVPVTRTRRYWYPATPTSRIQDGAKLVVFEAPQETLEGERIHQWIGARRSADKPAPRLPDLDRIERQQILARRLLQERFAFSRVVEDPTLVSLSAPDALERVASVRADWTMRTLSDVEPVTIEEKHVLIRRRGVIARLLHRSVR
jgi:anionic cell wall polymer biosynthesis LytR-Cps2A-Psr (LCP) family protein